MNGQTDPRREGVYTFCVGVAVIALAWFLGKSGLDAVLVVLFAAGGVAVCTTGAVQWARGSRQLARERRH